MTSMSIGNTKQGPQLADYATESDANERHSPSIIASKTRSHPMKTVLIAAGFILSLSLSNLTQAAEVTITTTLNAYQGSGAYLAFYLTDANGKYNSTLWVAGGKTKYYKHLQDWARGSGLKSTEYDGRTGASVTSGEQLTFKVTIDDALIDAGYLIRVDSAVEDQRDQRVDAEVALTRQGAGTEVAGRVYIKTIRYSL